MHQTWLPTLLLPMALAVTTACDSASSSAGDAATLADAFDTGADGSADAALLDAGPAADGATAPDAAIGRDSATAQDHVGPVDSTVVGDAAGNDDAATATDSAAPPDGAAPGGDGGPVGGCIQGSFTAYRGNLHAHTSHSDGEGSPAEAFAHARDVAGLDIQAITDHLEQIQLGSDWPECNAQADSATTAGSYLAICGFEYGSGFANLQSTGHNNVFFATALLPAVQLDFHDFYASLAACDGCVGQFNHPGSDPGQTWNDFEYFAEVDGKITLFEFNGGGETWNLLFTALDAGWHVAPVYNQDNHGADWGSKNDRRAGFYLADLGREALRSAMLERRAFMSMDRNASIQLISDGGCWMGSILTGLSSLSVTASASDPDSGDGFARIELYGPGGSLLVSHDCAGALSCSGQLSVPVSAPSYLLARAEQSDGEVLVSAPIWVQP